MLSVCPSSVLCYLITSQKQWHHSNKWQLKVFCVSFVSCFVFSLIRLSLCFPYHFKFSNCSFLWFKGFFKNITTHKEWTPQIHWKPKIFQCGNNASRIPDSHKVLHCCRLFAFTENPLHFLSSSIPADLRSSKTKFQEPPTFHHALSIYSQVQCPDKQTHFDQA